MSRQVSHGAKYFHTAISVSLSCVLCPCLVSVSMSARLFVAVVPIPPAVVIIHYLIECTVTHLLYSVVSLGIRAIDLSIF